MTSMDQTAEKLLVLITGTGRSGTSTMSGTLHHLGMYVPGPYLGADKSNPKGFFESRWAKRFHAAICERADIHVFDSRPEAFELVRQAVTDADRRKLTNFIAKKSADVPQLVVKDPRTVWVQRLWREAAQANGLATAYLSMLRHPAEVIGSRSTYYARAAGEDAESVRRKRKRYEILNVARWINNSIINERETRGQPRAYVRYLDMLKDWRAVVRPLQEQFGLQFSEDLAAGGGVAVDKFIDPSLNRHMVTWENLDVPRDLTELADQVWEQLQLIADADGEHREASAQMDALALAYEERLFEASAVDKDRADARVRIARLSVPAESVAEESQRMLPDLRATELLREVGRRAAERIRR